MTAITTPTISEEEYFKSEEKAIVRHEFIDGKTIEVPWENSWHETVVINIGIQLKIAKLRAVMHGLRVRCSSTRNYYYPDVLVYSKEGKGNLCYTESPLFITEVLSPSTRVNDFSDKFVAYRKFASLEYYLVVEPEFCYVNLFSKDEQGEWQSDLYTQLTDVVPLPKLSANLPVVSVYEGLDWTENA